MASNGHSNKPCYIALGREKKEGRICFAISGGFKGTDFKTKAPRDVEEILLRKRRKA